MNKIGQGIGSISRVAKHWESKSPQFATSTQFKHTLVRSRHFWYQGVGRKRCSTSLRGKRRGPAVGRSATATWEN